MCNSLQFSFDKGTAFLMYFVIVFYYSEKPMTIKLSKLCYFTGWIQVVLTYQLFTNCTDGVPSNLSGRRSISFSMFANLTGSSCRKNAKEVLSHPLVEPMNKSKTRVSTTIRCLSTHFRVMLFSRNAIIGQRMCMFVLNVVYVTSRHSVSLGGILVHFPFRHGTYL